MEEFFNSNMFNIHVRSIFKLLLPIDAPSNVTVVPFSQEHQFGFNLQSQDPTQTIKYNIQLFNVDDLRFVQPECFSFAKRRLHYSRASATRQNAIEGIVIRIQINHGFFDFRKSGTGGRINVRVDVTCFNSAGDFIQSGSSPIFLLYPKRRQARGMDDEDSTCIPISWADVSAINNNTIMPNLNLSLPPDQSSESDSTYSFPNLPQEYNSYIMPLEEVDNSFESSYEGHENDSIDINQAMQLYSQLVPQTATGQHGDSNEQYMVLYNGNAEVIGNFRALNFYKASDIRIKEDIRKLIDDYDCRDILMQIDGVAYRFKQGVSSSVNKRFVGFIAQQVESVVPEAVQFIDGILHVDYEALLPFLNEAIKKNYRDISNINTENQHIQQSIDILYAEFTKREAIVKYQHHPSSMFSDNARVHKSKPVPKKTEQRTSIWQWILFVLAGAVLFISGSVAVYFIAAQNRGPNTIPLTTVEGPPVPKTFDRDTDRRALEVLYMATGGAKWKNNYGWLTSLDICTWYGVKCSILPSRVTRLDLSSNGLSGTIPPLIAYLDKTTQFFLADNDIHGTLPPSLFKIPYIHNLDLYNNSRLSGTIPSDVHASIGDLSIYNCNLTGTLPTWISSSLTLNTLKVQGNRLTGQIPALPRLFEANFESNQFEGTFPKFIGPIPRLNLANNRLTGTIDQTQIIKAGILILANNSFSGQLPLTNSELANVDTLDISNNGFTSVRSDLVAPPRLQNCNASNNPFKCPIPDWLVKKCGATCK